MELINEVPPIKVEGRIVACEGGIIATILFLVQDLITLICILFTCAMLSILDMNSLNILTADSNPSLGHPIEFICLDLKDPAICKYCGLRYVQHDHHH